MAPAALAQRRRDRRLVLLHGVRHRGARVRLRRGRHVPAFGVLVLGYLIGQLGNLVPLPGGIGGTEGALVGVFALYGVNVSRGHRGSARLPPVPAARTRTARRASVRPAATPADGARTSRRWCARHSRSRSSSCRRAADTDLARDTTATRNASTRTPRRDRERPSRPDETVVVTATAAWPGGVTFSVRRSVARDQAARSGRLLKRRGDPAVSRSRRERRLLPRATAGTILAR